MGRGRLPRRYSHSRRRSPADPPGERRAGRGRGVACIVPADRCRESITARGARLPGNRQWTDVCPQRKDVDLSEPEITHPTNSTFWYVGRPCAICLMEVRNETDAQDAAF